MRITAGYLILFAAATGIRLYFNFSGDLIPGVNGGYYPLQVRALIETGSLSFPDMPLLFWFNALIIKLVSLFGCAVSDDLILGVVKITDSLSIPLLLIPLYRIVRTIQPGLPGRVELAVAAFSVLSFCPLVLTSDLQKNAWAVTLFYGCFACFLSFSAKGKKSHLGWSLGFLLLTGLTHFGTFVFALAVLSLVTLVAWKRRAILPLFAAAVTGVLIIAAFDTDRAERLFSLAAVAFERPALTSGMLTPPDYILILLSLLLAGYGTFHLKRTSRDATVIRKALLLSSVILLVVLSFPMLDGEYFRRLSLFLFIPGSLVVLARDPAGIPSRKNITSILLLLFTVLSLAAATGRQKEAVLTPEAFADLKKIRSVIRDPEKTMIIARHGLEWWTAWTLRTKVAQEKAMKTIDPDRYASVMVLVQTGGFSRDHDRQPFHEPRPPASGRKVYSSDFFRLLEISPGPGESRE